MKIHLPALTVACLQSPQTGLIAKFGGLPWGFPGEKWPVCEECGTQMSLVAQLPHDPAVALDLGDESHVLHLFQCPTGGCSSYTLGAGCTAAVIVSRNELGDAPTPPPFAGPPKANPYVTMSHAAEDGGSVLERFANPQQNGEFWITGWSEYEDDIRPEQRPVYFDYSAFTAATDDERQPPSKITPPGGDPRRYRTKTGGFPYWGEFGNVPERDTFDFLLQIDSFFSIDGSLPAPEDIGCDVFRRSEKRGYDPAAHLRVPEDRKKVNAPWSVMEMAQAGEFCAEFANFGSDGSAYVFIDRTRSPPDVVWSWSR